MLDRRSEKFNKRTPAILSTKDMASEPLVRESPIAQLKANGVSPAPIAVPAATSSTVSVSQTIVHSQARRDLQISLMDQRNAIADMRNPIPMGAKIPRSVYDAFKAECERLDLPLGDVATMAIVEFTKTLKLK